MKKTSELIEDLCFRDKSEGREKNNDASDNMTEHEPVKKQPKMDNDDSIVIVDLPVQGEKEETTVDVWVQCDMCTLNFEDKRSLSQVWN